MPPRRNDPCPCGSGKKYKKCCMLKEKTSTIVLTHHLLRKTADQVPDLLLGYAKKIYGEEAIFEAWDDFWITEMEPKEDISNSPYLQLFTPWFMYHWYPGDEARYNPDLQFPCEHTTVAQFLKRIGWKVDSFTKRYLESAQKEPLSFWQIEAVEPEKGILLKDLAVERERFVREVSGSKTLKKWDIILGQVVGLDGEYTLSATGPYSLTPSRFREYITGFINRIRKHRSFAAVDLLEYDIDFLARYHNCVEEILNPTLPEIRNTDGDKLVFTTSRYTFKPTNREDIIVKLKSMRNFEYDGDKEDESEFAWTIENKKKAMMQTVTKGNIKVGLDHILTDCNSKPRDKYLRNRLVKNLGDLIKHKDTTHNPYDSDELPDALPEASGESSALDLDTLSEDARQQLVEFLEQEYMNWTDQRIPALQDKTPKEAVKTPKGREKVADLINDWENTQLRMPDRQFEFDFNKLRVELGLEVE